MILLCFFILCPHINCIDFFFSLSNVLCGVSALYRRNVCSSRVCECLYVFVYHCLFLFFCIIFTRTRDIIWIAYYIHIYYPFGVQLACVHCAIELNGLVTIHKKNAREKKHQLTMSGAKRRQREQHEKSKQTNKQMKEIHVLYTYIGTAHTRYSVKRTKWTVKNYWDCHRKSDQQNSIHIEN